MARFCASDSMDMMEREKEVELANKQMAIIELWCQSIKDTSRSRRPYSQNDYLTSDADRRHD